VLRGGIVDAPSTMLRMVPPPLKRWRITATSVFYSIRGGDLALLLHREAGEGDRPKGGGGGVRLRHGKPNGQ
jgi:hypothetical protein